MKMEKLNPFLIPDSHKSICESGLSGQRHIGKVSLRAKLSKNFADVDGLRDLQTVIVLNVRWRTARRSRPPQINISDMPLTDQEKRTKKAQGTKQNRKKAK